MPAERKRNRVYSPWSNIIVQTRWTVASVRSALDSHERGMFSQSGLLIDALGRDPRLGTDKSGVVGTRANGLLGKPFSLRPADEDDPRAVRAAEEIEAIWWDILPESELRTLLRYLWFGGGAPGELRWKRKDGRWHPVVKSWQLHHLFREERADGEQLYERWWLNTRSGQVDFTPGDGKWLLLADGDRWWLNGSVRSLSIPWLGAQLVFRDALRHSERLGMPIIKALHPAQADPDEVDAWFSDLKALATETAAKLPQNVDGQGTSFDLALLEASGDNWESFEALLKHIHTIYAVHFLGHNLTTEVDSGSFAAANTGNDVRLDYIKADFETISTPIRQQVLVPLCAEWYPGGEDLAPWPHWDVEPPENTKEAAETTRVAGEALQSLKKAGYRPKDMNAWSERFGLELEEIPEEEKPQLPPQPPPVPVPPQDGSAEPSGSDESEPEEPDDAQLHLLSGDAPETVPGLVGGQQMADQLVDEGLPLAQRAMAPDVKALLEVVDGVLADGGDMQEMTDRLVELYREMSPSRLTELLEKAEILAELKGMASVLEDL